MRHNTDEPDKFLAVVPKLMFLVRSYKNHVTMLKLLFPFSTDDNAFTLKDENFMLPIVRA